MKTNLNYFGFSLMPANLVYVGEAWPETRGSVEEPTLAGYPNPVEMKFKTKEKDPSDATKMVEVEKTTEDPDTAKGRNVIRGQAIMVVRMFPFENEDSSNNLPGTGELHDWIMISRCKELGVPVPTGLLMKVEAKELDDYQEDDGKGGVKVKKLDKDELNTQKVAAAKTLGEKLNAFRAGHTEAKGDKTVWKAPATMNRDYEYINWLPSGRNFVRGEAQKWLAANPRTAANESNYDAVKAALEKSTKMETEQWWNEKDVDKTDPNKPVYTPRTKPATKAEIEQSKADASKELNEALTTAQA